MKQLIIIIIPLFVLAACGAQTPRPEVRIIVRDRMVFAEPDPSLRECMARLERRTVSTDAQIAQLIADSFEVGDDCRAKLAATWRSIDDTRARVEAFNRAQQEAKPQ